jgi:hypothetical protein
MTSCTFPHEREAALPRQVLDVTVEFHARVSCNVQPYRPLSGRDVKSDQSAAVSRTNDVADLDQLHSSA